MVSVNPVLLLSKVDIAKAFKVRLQRVVHWHKLGAPITFDGKRYTTELNALQAWLVDNKNMPKCRNKKALKILMFSRQPKTHN